MTLIDTNCPVSWPKIEEAQPAENEDWELIESHEISIPKPASSIVRQSSIPKSVSTPDFSHYSFCEEDSMQSWSVAGSSVVHDVVYEHEDGNIEKDDSFDVVCTSEKKPEHAMKRVPSFKDAVLLNAEACEKEETAKKAAQRRAMQNLSPRKVQQKFQVKKIPRNARSMTDLASLVEVEDEDEICGDTDAGEYYARKSKGSTARANSSKLRPDEAKRKQYIMYKKNAQRAANA